jgi:hypothetical protein
VCRPSLSPTAIQEKQCIVALAEDFAALALRLCVRRLGELPAATQRLVGSLLGSAAPPALQWQVATVPAEHAAAARPA